MSGSPLNPSLILQAAATLEGMSIASDRLLLTAWYASAVIQRLIGEQSGPQTEFAAAEKALNQLLCGEQAGSLVDLLRLAYGQLSRSSAMESPLLGVVTESSRQIIRQEITVILNQDESLDGEIATSSALEVFQTLPGQLCAGARHRFGLLLGAATDAGSPRDTRRAARAAIACIERLQPDPTFNTPLLHAFLRDSAARVALCEFVPIDPKECFHWTERIMLLVDGLPFLLGIDLVDGGNPSVVTWLDRVNAYVGYKHVWDRERAPLVCIEPSTVCSPVHLILSLLGLLVLEGITSFKNLAARLAPGQVYEVDGKYHCEYTGTSAEMNGMLRLRFKDGFIYCSPDVARRMVPVADTKLSRAKEFAAVTAAKGGEPLQQFFGWSDAIGIGTISGRLVFVSSRDRATKLFGNISSNGVLLTHGLIGFAGPDDDFEHLPTTIIIVPTLAAARQIVDRRDDISAIIVDGYDRLKRGRNELPFLQMSQAKPPMIVWSHQGEVPPAPPEWLSDQKCFAFRREDLRALVDLDRLGAAADTITVESIRAAANLAIERAPTLNKESELRAIAKIADFVEMVVKSSEIPEFWKYHLLSLASKLRALIDATPAYWEDIKSYARAWEEEFAEGWLELRPAAARALEPIREAHARMLGQIDSVADIRTSKADMLLSFLASQPDREWFVVCDFPQQISALERFVARGAVPVKLQDLEACTSAIVCGWTNVSFARRVGARTPTRLVLIGDDHDYDRWHRTMEPDQLDGTSFIDFIQCGEIRLPAPKPTTPSHVIHAQDTGEDREEVLSTFVDCIFIWPSEGSVGKVVERSSRILVAREEHVAEKRANLISPGDRVILGRGSRRWSPAEEFTQAVVETIEISSPALIRHARAWRMALWKAYKAKGSSIRDLKATLDNVQVKRELLTIEGWLHLDRAAPIGPQHIRKELEAMWPVIGQLADIPVEEAIHACSRLRSLRSMAGRVLLKEWKGYQSESGVDRDELAALLMQLKRQVEVHEVERISFGRVPSMMLGWWTSEETADQFTIGASSATTLPSPFLELAEEIELADE